MKECRRTGLSPAWFQHLKTSTFSNYYQASWQTNHIIILGIFENVGKSGFIGCKLVLTWKACIWLLLLPIPSIVQNIKQYFLNPFPLSSVFDFLCKFMKESGVRTLAMSENNGSPKIKIFIGYSIRHKLINLGTISEIKTLHSSEKCCAIARLLVSSLQPYESYSKI